MTRQTIFDRLRAYHTEGRPLSELIAEACDVGDACVDALGRAGEHINSLRDEYSVLDTTADPYPDYILAVLARAYATNGDSNGNGARKSAA